MNEQKRYEARAQHHKKEIEYEKRRKAQEEKYKEEVSCSEIWKMGLRRANPKEYAEWIDRHLEKGGEITNVYDYDMPSRFFAAKADIFVTPLFGVSSVYIIVPSNIKVTYNDLGHNTIFCMSDGSSTGGAPLYSNT